MGLLAGVLTTARQKPSGDQVLPVDDVMCALAALLVRVPSLAQAYGRRGIVPWQIADVTGTGGVTVLDPHIAVVHNRRVREPRMGEIARPGICLRVAEYY